MSSAEHQQHLAQAFRLFSIGDLAGAERVLATLLLSAPNDPNALQLLAGVKRAAGDYAGALRLLDQALAQAPQAASLQFNRANLLLETGRAEEALAGFDTAIRLRPDHADSHLNCARALRALERYGEAIESCNRALAIGAQKGALSERGVSLFRLARHEEALADFDLCIAENPNDGDAHFNRARCLQALDRLDESLAAYDCAAALSPANADLLHNRAVLLQWMNRPAGALGSFDAALTLAPMHGPTLYTKGVALLSFGDYARGWPLHELRHQPGVLPAMRELSRGEPGWRGEPIKDVLRIWPEQGIGDEILFARLALLARARTERVIVECADRLVPLFARSFPGIDVRAPSDDAPPAAAQIAAGSLGAVLGVTKTDLGEGAPYMFADVGRVAKLRGQYRALAQGRPIIGLAWASKNPNLGAHKSTTLGAWGALLRRDCFFVNLQYGDTAADVAGAQERFGRTIYSDPSIDQLTDLDAFAAQVCALDHVVSVSNTTVHMAGALGATCTVLVPPAQGLLWYWGAGGASTPWYASVRIARRAPGQTWADQIASVAETLSF
jgi:tetratricopeptide (TPR) repeat protein